MKRHKQLKPVQHVNYKGEPISVKPVETRQQAQLRDFITKRAFWTGVFKNDQR